nr:GNAT family N-acetyltransferase [uncultured Desulfobacter sp.]
MKITIAKSKHQRCWNRFLDNRRNGNLYQLFEWRKILQEGYKLTPFFLMAEQDGCVSGVLPLVKAPLLTGRPCVISLPYCDFSGIEAVDSETSVALVKEAENIATKERGTLSLRQKGVVVDDNLPYECTNVLQEVKIPKTEEDIMAICSSNLRRKIRKSVKNGIKFKCGKNYLDEFYAVYTKNMHYLGTPHHSKHFFKTIIHYLNEKCEIFVAEYKDTIIGGMFVLKYKKMARDPWTSTLREYNRLYPSNLLYYNALRFAVKHQLDWFDFGRSQLNTGVYQFKKQWGSIDSTLYYSSSNSDTPSNSKFMLTASNIWKKIPYGITLPMGQYLRKYLH